MIEELSAFLKAAGLKDEWLLKTVLLFVCVLHNLRKNLKSIKYYVFNIFLAYKISSVVV